MARYSKLWFISKELLQRYYDESSTQKEVLLKAGLNDTSGSHRTLKTITELKEIDLTKFLLNHKKFRESIFDRSRTRRDYNNDLIINSTADRGKIKKFILSENLIDYKCKHCDNNGFHNGKPLSLQLEHINGVSNDNRLENLCFLCPNCHSQTPTYAGKNAKKVKNEKVKNVKVRKRKFDPSKDELESLLKNSNLTAIGRFYGVSGNAVRKRCKLLGVL